MTSDGKKRLEAAVYLGGAMAGLYLGLFENLLWLIPGVMNAYWFWDIRKDDLRP